MSAVSGNRPVTLDHRRKPTPQPKPVGLARVTYLSDTQVQCSCGWPASHARPKVLEDRIDAHLNKKHGGRGIRL